MPIQVLQRLIPPICVWLTMMMVEVTPDNATSFLVKLPTSLMLMATTFSTMSTATTTMPPSVPVLRKSPMMASTKTAMGWKITVLFYEPKETVGEAVGRATPSICGFGVVDSPCFGS